MCLWKKNCWSKLRTVESRHSVVARNLQQLLQLFLFAVTLYVLCVSGAQRVTRLTPKVGSLNGATRLTIAGEGMNQDAQFISTGHITDWQSAHLITLYGLWKGFAQDSQFSLKDDEDVGNRVYLVSDTLSIPCDVERDSTHGNQITCYTR